MNNLETYDPHLAQKLERRGAKVTEYKLWVWDGHAARHNVCDTIEEARCLWVKAKSEKWDRWELQQDGKIIKKGVF